MINTANNANIPISEIPIAINMAAEKFFSHKFFPLLRTVSINPADIPSVAIIKTEFVVTLAEEY